MKKLLVICTTVVLLTLIGAWVYVQKQDMARKEQQNKSQQQLDVKKLKYQQCQINNRYITAEIDKGNTFASLGTKNCDLIL